eukprot:c17577_g1_i2.p1 GENE.c17577_g1_i2~~c17577_g1_i2.p1  ORF type:complete len:539 (+),score=104.90 c17577_g1_i2:20-1636(+)
MLRSDPRERAVALAEETSLHGIPFVLNAVRERNVLCAGYWTILFLASAGLCGYMLSSRVTYFMSNPKATTVNLVVSEALELPQITLCNRSPFDRRRLQAWQNQGRPNSTKFCWNNTLARCDRDCEFGKFRDCATDTCVDFENLTASSIVRSCQGACVPVTNLGYGTACNDTISCIKTFQIAGGCPDIGFVADSQLSDLVNRLLSDPLLVAAMSFSIEDVLIASECLIGIEQRKCTFSDFTTTFVGLDIGNCFTFERAVFQSSPGVRSGVSFVLDSIPDGQTPIHLLNLYETQGFFVILHERNSKPNKNRAIPISAGVENLIRVTQKQFHDNTSNAVCNPSPGYSDTECVDTCISEYLATNCPDPESVLHCLSRVGDTATQFCSTNLKCPPKCSFITYTPIVSQTLWPTGVARSIILDFLKSQDACVDVATDCVDQLKSLVRLSVFFGELTFQEITKTDTYPLSALVSEIGGTTGLFLGCGMLTIAELLTFFAFAMAACYQRRRKPLAQEPRHLTSLELARAELPDEHRTVAEKLDPLS